MGWEKTHVVHTTSFKILPWNEIFSIDICLIPWSMSCLTVDRIMMQDFQFAPYTSCTGIWIPVSMSVIQWACVKLNSLKLNFWLFDWFLVDAVVKKKIYLTQAVAAITLDSPNFYTSCSACKQASLHADALLCIHWHLHSPTSAASAAATSCTHLVLMGVG